MTGNVSISPRGKAHGELAARKIGPNNANIDSIKTPPGVLPVSRGFDVAALVTYPLPPRLAACEADAADVVDVVIA